mgnify:CR=1 FL=1
MIKNGEANGKKGKIAGIRKNKDSIWITVEADDLVMDRLDKILDLYSGRDIHDKISGIKNYHSYKSWRWIESIPVGNKHDAACYLIFKPRLITIIIIRGKNYRKTFEKILEYFEFKRKKSK